MKYGATIYITMAVIAICILVWCCAGPSKNPPEHQKVEDLLRNGMLNHISDLVVKHSKGQRSRAEALEQASAIICAASKYDIDWRIIYALARTEVPNFDYSYHHVYTEGKHIGKHDGYGNMQVLLSTARMFEPNICERSLTVPSKNYDIGTAYFVSMYKYFGTTGKAIMAYKRGYNSAEHDKTHLKLFRKFRGELK